MLARCHAGFFERKFHACQVIIQHGHPAETTLVIEKKYTGFPTASQPPTSGHPDIPLAVFFPDATCVTGTHPPQGKTRFITRIEGSTVY